MTRRTIETPNAPRPIGPYVQGVLVDGVLYCAGQIGLDPETGRLVEGDFATELTRVIENLRAVLRAAGLELADVVKTTVYLRDLGDGPVLNEVYARLLPAPHPARATVQVAGLPAGARVEIDAIAQRAR
jgi:2-iminobutanoate/2-iminopropanoate deaminase